MVAPSELIETNDPFVSVPQGSVFRDLMTQIRVKGQRPNYYAFKLHEATGVLMRIAASSLKTAPRRVETVMGTFDGVQVAQKIALVPVMTAGGEMVQGARSVLDVDHVWHHWLKRNRTTLMPELLSTTIPDHIDPGTACFVLETMWATGGSGSNTIQYLKDRGAQSVVAVGLIASSQGIANLREWHPDVRLVIGAIDPELDSRGYILPGIGDMGDLLYGREPSH